MTTVTTLATCNSFKMTGVEHAAAGVHASQFGERVLVDDLGPFPVKCIVSGALYCRKYTDEATGMWAFYAVRQFTSEGTIQVTKEYMGDHSWLLPKAGTFRIFRTDNGSVLSSQKVRDYFDDEGATWEGSVPRDPKQRWERMRRQDATLSWAPTVSARVPDSQASRAARTWPSSRCSTMVTCTTTLFRLHGVAPRRRCRWLRADSQT